MCYDGFVGSCPTTMVPEIYLCYCLVKGNVFVILSDFHTYLLCHAEDDAVELAWKWRQVWYDTSRVSLVSVVSPPSAHQMNHQIRVYVAKQPAAKQPACFLVSPELMRSSP